MKKYQTLFALIFASCCFASPALAGPPFNVEDPETPELHNIEMNIAYISSQVRGSESQAFPSFDLGYGYLNNLQLSLGLTGISVRNSPDGRVAGFGDISLGAKWRFQEETKHRPQFALGYDITLPTASASRGLGSGYVDHTLLFVAQKSWGRSTCFGHVGCSLVGARDSRDPLLYGLAYTYQATEHLNLGAELYGNSSAAVGERSELAWGLGMTYRFAPDRALLLKAGRSVQGFSDLNVYAGVQFNFGSK